jgi:Skp family chaperone for outer membrane proteins
MRNLLFVSLAIIAVAAIAQDGPKPAVPAAPQSKILVLNMLRTVDESEEGKDFIAKLREEQAAKKQELTEQEATLQKDIQILREAKPADRNPEYYVKLEKAMDLQAKLQKEKNLFLAQKQDQLTRAMEELLRLAQQKARDVMKKRGAEVVLLSKLGPIELATEQDHQQELLMRRVLCNEEALDITDEVIKSMNDWYKQNKKQ